jgi:hypothetical protein
MKFLVCLLGTLILLFGARTGACEMDAKTLIQLLNFSQTLIQDGEIQTLWYNNHLTHPDDVGTAKRKLIALWEEQMRENVPKSQNPEVLRKRLIKHIEDEKKYRDFGNSDERFVFIESNFVFQKLPGNAKEPLPQYAYRCEDNFLFENYPSLEHLRFFLGGGQHHFFSNRSKNLMGSPPNPFSKNNHIGYFEHLKKQGSVNILEATKIPPGLLLNETQSEVRFLEDGTSEPTYLITHRTPHDVKMKIYVRIQESLPEVFRQEIYLRSESPHADTEGYWLVLLKEYRDFEWIPTLSMTLPKVRDEKEFRADGFMRRHTIYTIKEMDFNLGLPENFFDWDESELTDDIGRRKRIRGEVQEDDKSLRKRILREVQEKETLEKQKNEK